MDQKNPSVLIYWPSNSLLPRHVSQTKSNKNKISEFSDWKMKHWSVRVVQLCPDVPHTRRRPNFSQNKTVGNKLRRLIPAARTFNPDNLHSYRVSRKLRPFTASSSVHRLKCLILGLEYHFKRRQCLAGCGERGRIMGSWVCLFVPSTRSACDERGGLQP